MNMLKVHIAQELNGSKDFYWKCLTIEKTHIEDSGNKIPIGKIKTVKRDVKHLNLHAGGVNTLNRDNVISPTSEISNKVNAPVEEHRSPNREGHITINIDNGVHLTPKQDGIRMMGPGTKIQCL